MASPTNLPSRSSKPLASSAHSGRPTISSSTPASSDDAGAHHQVVARQVQRAGDRCRGGEARQAHAAKTLSRSGGRATSSRLPICDAEVADQVAREVGHQRDVAVARTFSVARQKAPTKSSSATSTGTRLAMSAGRSRTRTSSGRMQSAHLRARPPGRPASGRRRSRPPTLTRVRRHRACRRGSSSSRRSRRRRPSPAGGRSPAACRPARSRRGSSPRCGRPW